MKQTLTKLILAAAIIICCGNAYAAQKCGILVGYTKFANSSGATGAFCTNNLLYEGTANESHYSSFNCGDPIGSGSLNQGYYTIVPRAGNFGSNGNPTINYTPATGGGLFAVNTFGNQDFAVYSINGLTTGQTYNVRVVLVGLSDVPGNSWCNQQRMRPQVYITRPGGATTSGGGLGAAATRRLKTLTQPTGCTSDITDSGTGIEWDNNNGGQQTLNPNGHRLEFTCQVTVGGNGGTQWADTGFEIHFKYSGNQNQTYQYILGIEEIEVSGCVEQEIISSQGINPCEGSPTTLAAGGLGMTTDLYEWSANGTVIPGETGYRITVIPPVGTTTNYTVKNVGSNAAFWNPSPPGYLSIAVTPVNCCGAAATRFTVPKICCTPPSMTTQTSTDIAWNMAPWVTVNKNVGIDGNAPNCPGAITNPAGRWRSVYDDTYIYFLVQLGNTPINYAPGGQGWGGSGVEIYLANNNRNPANAQTQQKQFGFGLSTPNIIYRYGINGPTFGNEILFQEAGIWYFKTRIPLTANGYSPNNPYMYVELTINQSVTGNCRTAQIATWNTSANHFDRADGYSIAPFSSCASVVAVPDTVCAGETVNLSTQMTAVGGTTYTWEQSLNQTTWVAIQGAAAPSTTNTINNVTPTNGGTAMPSGIIYYRALHGGVPTCPAKVVILPSVAVTNTVGATVCAGATAQISATVASGTVSWYSGSSGGTAIGTSASGALWTTPTVSNTTIFYAEATANTCPGSARVPVTVTVTPTNTITLTSAPTTETQTVCVGDPITDITYYTRGVTGATGATVTNLPAGVTGVFTPSTTAVFPPEGTVTISGTPTAAGTFNYTVTLNGGCGNITATGTITVNPLPVVAITTTPTGVTHLTCAVTSITLTASGAGTGGSYLWSTGAATPSINVTAAGTYKVTATTDKGCSKTDSIIITQDINMPEVKVNNQLNGSTTICNGASTTLTASGATTYTWTAAGGFNQTGGTITVNPNNTTIYTVNGVAGGAGCSAQTTFTVYVNPTYSHTDAVTICESELPYMYHGLPYYGGTHTVPLMSVNHCDSTITLTVNVTPLDRQYTTLNICKADLPYPYQNPAYGINTVFGIGTVSGSEHVFYQDCGSMTITVYILESVNSQQPVFPTVCADDGFFYIQIEPTGAAGDVVATQYEVTFPTGSGFDKPMFNPQSGNVENGNKIRIDIPTDIYPDIYTCTIELINLNACANKKFVNVTFDVYYPSSIMQQKWDNVIALLNEYYNGGYQFTGYQWFKNGYIMQNETNSYIYLGNTPLNLTDEYYVELTRPDGSKMFSCPAELKAVQPPVSVYPTVVSSGGNITIYKSPKKAVVKIYTVTGILVGSNNLDENQINTIAAPPQQGIYLLEIRTIDSSEKQVIPIVVSR